ncbi:MAG TPA: PAS domain S-box protein [Spirochaetia bacterium]|nr:PAS domain S-box protein [Spirochaetia bacterium]
MSAQQGQGGGQVPERLGGTTRTVFRFAAVAMIELDISRARESLKELRKSGVTDLPLYLDEHPEYALQVLSLLEIVDINDAALRLFEAETKESFVANFGSTVDSSDRESIESVKQTVCAIDGGGEIVNSEAAGLTLKGKRIHLRSDVYVPNEGDPYPFALATIVDISMRKHAEERVLHLNRLYAVLSAANHTIARRHDRESLWRELCDTCIRRGGFRMAWIGVVDETTRMVTPAASAGVTGGYLESLSISIEDIPLGQGPTGRCIRERSVVACNDIEHDPSMAPWRGPALEGGYRSSASVSFGQDGVLRGALSVYSEEPGWFGEDEVGLLNEIGSDLSFALRGIAQEEARMRSEAALAYERNLLRTLIDHIPDGIFAMDTDRRLTLVNPADVKVYGRESADEVLGHTDAELFSPDVASNFDTDNKAVLEEGRAIINREEYYLDPSGQTRWLLTSKLPLRDPAGKIVGLVGVGRDITEARAAESRIREQAQLLDIASDAIVVRNVSGEIRYWNRSAETLFGWSAREALGRSANELIRAERPLLLEEALRVVLESREWKGELFLLRRDDRMFWGEMRWTLVLDAHGKPDAVLMVTSDITERRTVEERLMRVQRLESLGTLASGIAHDLNNVLTPIVVGIDALAAKSKDETSTRILNVMQTSSHRGSEIISQILGFARGGTGEFAEVHLEPILREIEEIVRETFPKSVELRVKPFSKLWDIVGNRTQIHQVLMNLAVNARDAMEERGILTLGAENVTVDEAYTKMNPEAKAANYVVLTVEDTGVGMSPKTLARVFDPFFTTKGVGKGTGLGLSTSRTIVASHGGFINVYSEQNKGSSFRVYLPATASAEAAAEVRTVEEMPTGKGEIILVVDDEAAVREITKQILETHGYEVIAVDDGTAALVVFNERKNHIALVLCDMVMPFLDGKATIRAITQIDPAVRVIAMSGMASKRRISTELPAGAAFLAKPYTALQLLKAVRDALASP